MPGAGQIYNGKYVKCILYLSADTYMLYNAISNSNQYRDTDDITYRDERNKYLWWGAGTWLLGALDAYVDAHLSLFPDENIEIGTRGGDRSVSLFFQYSF